VLGLIAIVWAWESAGRKGERGGIPTSMVVNLTGFLAIVLLVWLVPFRPDMSQYKALSRTRLMPETEVLEEATTPLGVLTIVRGPALRSANGLSLSYQGELRPRPVAFLDGNTIGTLPLLADTSASAPLRHTSFTLPYRIRSFGDSRAGPRRVLVLNAGPGSEVHQALMEHSAHVTAAIRNGGLLHALETVSRNQPELPSIYGDQRVELIIREPRNALHLNGQRFDVVMVPPIGGVVGASSAMQAIYEDHLLTREGIAAMMNRLSPQGLLCITTWLDIPPRRPLKLFALLAEALEHQGLERPGEHLAALSSWNAFTAVLSPRPWSPPELRRIRQYAHQEGFDLLYLPGDGDDRQETVYHQPADTTLVPSLATLAAGGFKRELIPSPFQLHPPTDNRPFFHHFLTLRSIPMMRRLVGGTGVMLAEWGYVLLWVTLGLLVVGGAVLILLPLWLHARARRPHYPDRESVNRPLSLAYFGAIGCGFMAVEIVLIQKLVLVLGDPVFAASAVITALLVFAGIGSILSEYLKRRWARLVPAGVGLIAIFLLAVFMSVTHLAPAWASMPGAGRFVVVIVVLAPLAIVMGIFFPTGVRWLDTAGEEARIPWAWGINGFTSVITTPVATIVALNLGFTMLGVVGVGCYLLAAAVSFRWWINRRANQPTPIRKPIVNSHQG
ncbi:MAG: hypothetical protein JSW54_12720, partial [Fidelibacterota bacterium]